MTGRCAMAALLLLLGACGLHRDAGNIVSDEDDAGECE